MLEVNVFDLSGRLIKKEPFTDPFVTGDLPGGMYLIKVTDNLQGGTLTGRIIINN